MTTPSIERAYKKDEALLWRITAAMVGIEDLTRARLGHLVQVVTYSSHFAPYFNRYRTVRLLIVIGLVFTSCRRMG